MRIGNDDNFLRIDFNPLEGGYSAFKVEAVGSGSKQRFTVVDERVIIDSSREAFGRLVEFSEFRSNEFETQMSGSGWLRFSRDSRGYIKVRYRIGIAKASTAMEGQVEVDGEFAGSFCREFDKLLRSDQELS